MNPQTYTAPQEQQEAPASFAAILPLLLFLLIFIGTGVSLSLAGVDMAFYQLSATVAILPAIALALMQGRARLSKKITIFLTGVGEINIITMCMIYLLAGGFAATATAIGSVDATVNFGLSLVPPAFILPGLFLIGAFVSTAMGTSMGTVAAITPIALGVAAQTSIEVPVLMGVVLGFLAVTTQSLYVGMMLHTAYNSFLVLISFTLGGAADVAGLTETGSMLEIVGGATGVIALGVEALIAGGILVAILRGVYLRRAREEGLEPVPKSPMPMDGVQIVVLISALVTVAFLYGQDVLSLMGVLK